VTSIRIIDEPCGSGKTTGLIKELKQIRDDPSKKGPVIIVVPFLDEIERYQKELGKDWLPEPVSENGGKKIDALIELLKKGSNVITTHALYERFRLFEHLLASYDVIIDEVPTVVKQLPVYFGDGLRQHLLNHKQYITIDPSTNIIKSTDHWQVDKQVYESGDDLHIKDFMDTVEIMDVSYVELVFYVVTVPDTFFTKPKSVTILTFLFEGTQLHHWLLKQGFQFQHFWDSNELAQFKADMNKNLYVRNITKPLKLKTGFTNMTDKKGKIRIQVATWAKNNLKVLRKFDPNFRMDQVLVASHKNAWYGDEENKFSVVSNKSSLKTRSGLGKAQHTTLITRGTNRFKHLDALFLLGKVNMHPSLKKYLGMNTQKAADRHTLTELVQLIYRTAIRDDYPIYLLTPDQENIRILKEFLNS